MEDAALLVIDQQKGIDNPKLGQRNNPHAEAAILALLTHWRGQQRPVIHVRHRSTEPESVFWPFQDGFEFKPAFQPKQNEATIVITGAATNNSVEATARTAGCRGFRTYVVEDACFTFAKRDYRGRLRSAEAVHDMSLANLDGEYAEVVSSQRWLPLDAVKQSAS